MNIHSTAVVSPKAEIAEGVQIGPYAIIAEDVCIGKNSIIGPHAVVDRYTRIGESCHLYQFCSVGALPQDLKFKGEPTYTILGNHNTIREFVTVHRATAADSGKTILGDHNYLMAYSHVAHNCQLGNHVVMANAANLAGHVTVDDFAIIGGLAGIHQFTRIGAHAFIGGASGVIKDIPPYVLVSGNFSKLYGLNIIGLKRRGFAEEALKSLKEAYRIVFRSSLRLSVALAKVRQEVPDCPELRYFIDFIEKSKRGVCR